MTFLKKKKQFFWQKFKSEIDIKEREKFFFQRIRFSELISTVGVRKLFFLRHLHSGKIRQSVYLWQVFLAILTVVVNPLACSQELRLVRLWPCLQMLSYAENTCQRQTLWRILKECNVRRKKFYKIETKLLLSKKMTLMLPGNIIGRERKKLDRKREREREK